jgi:hypothetical protein
MNSGLEKIGMPKGRNGQKGGKGHGGKPSVLELCKKNLKRFAEMSPAGSILIINNLNCDHYFKS